MKAFSRRKGTIAQLTSNYAMNFLRLLQGLVLIPLYLKYVGNDLYGAWLATGSIIAYLGLSDFGLNSVLLRKVAHAYGEQNEYTLNRYIGSGLVVVLGLSLVPVIFCIIFSFFLHHIISIAPQYRISIRIAFIIAGVSTTLNLIMYAVAGVVRAFQYQFLGGIVQVVSTLLSITTTIILLLLGSGIYSIPLGALVYGVCAIAGEATILFLVIPKNISCTFHPKISFSTIKELIKPSVWFFFARGSSTIANQSDNLLIGMAIDTKTVVLYSIAKKIFDLLFMIVGHVSAAFTPALSHFFGELKGNVVEAKQLTNLLIHTITVLAFFSMVGYCIFIKDFISLWVGDSYYPGFTVVLLLSIYGILYMYTNALRQVIFSAGKIITTAIASGSEAILRITMVYLLAKFFGLAGVCLAALLSIILSGFWLLTLSYMQIFSIPFSLTLSKVKNGAGFILIIMGIIIIGYFSTFWPSSKNYFTFAYTACIYAVTAIAWMFIADASTRKALLQKLSVF